MFVTVCIVCIRYQRLFITCPEIRMVAVRYLFSTCFSCGPDCFFSLSLACLKIIEVNQAAFERIVGRLIAEVAKIV